MTKGVAPDTFQSPDRSRAAAPLLKLKEQQHLVADMGPYESLSKNQGCNPKGIVKMLPLINGFVSLPPTFELRSSSLRTALFQLLLENRINQTKLNGTVFINLRIERFTALLYHFRRLNCAEDLRCCASQLTSPELLEVLELVDRKEAPEPCLALVPLDKSEDKQGEAASSSRKLKENLSEVSLDSEGFPNMFKEPPSSSAAPPLPAALPKGSVDERAPAFMPSRPARQAVLVPLECVDVSPCLKGLPKDENKKKKKRNVKKTLGKKAAACNEGRAAASTPEARAPWAKLKLTEAKKPEKAYIQGTLTKGEKLRLIVEITRRMSENYLAHVEAIYNKLEAESLTKAEALEERERSSAARIESFCVGDLIANQVWQPCQKVCQSRLRCSLVKMKCLAQ